MRLMFWGFFFAFLNFGVSYDGHYINLIPPWVGFLLLYVCAGRLRDKSQVFERVRLLCLGLALYTFSAWFVDVLRGSGALGLIGWIMGFLSTIMALYTCKIFINGIGELEQSFGADLDSVRLLRIWKLLAIADVIAYILGLIPLFNLVGLLVAAVAGIFFLVHLWRSTRAGAALGL